MTAAELILHLQNFPPTTEVMMLDGVNGEGCKRNLNFIPLDLGVIGSTWHDLGPADCEGRHGEKVITLGYGCY